MKNLIIWGWILIALFIGAGCSNYQIPEETSVIRTSDTRSLNNDSIEIALANSVLLAELQAYNDSINSTP